jgi:signal transduction histidine kinase
LGGITAIAFLREWSLRRTQQRLAQEKEALLRQTQQQQAQLLQAERMANLGLLAAHIAHEINTPLGVIHTALKEAQEGVSAPEAPLPAETRPTPARFRELRQAWQTAYPALSPLLIQQAALLGYTPDQYPALERWLNNPEHWEKLQKSLSFHQALQRAQEAAERLQARLQAIRTYVRRIAEQPLTQVSLKESLQHTLDFYRPLMRKVEATLEAPAQPLYVEASPARLEQVWANLIQNALQAMPEGGILHIRLQAVGDKAQVLIQDSGKGVPPHLREKIFEPLVTTKAPGEGTGLGLPLCREIVESYGGQLRLLHSEPGYTLFGVELPLASPPLRELDTPRADSGLSEKEKEPTPDR